MTCSYRRNCVAAALLPLFLSGGVVAAPGIDSTRPDAPGITQPYESAFKNYQPATDEATSPDKLWRGANDAVAGQGSHGSMAGMQMDGPMTMSRHGSGEKPMPMDMRMPGANAKSMDMTMPMDHSMPMPAGHARPVDKAMPMLKKAPKNAPAPAAPMPPGMDMHEGHKGK